MQQRGQHNHRTDDLDNHLRPHPDDGTRRLRMYEPQHWFLHSRRRPDFPSRNLRFIRFRLRARLRVRQGSQGMDGKGFRRHHRLRLRHNQLLLRTRRHHIRHDSLRHNRPTLSTARQHSTYPQRQRAHPENREERLKFVSFFGPRRLAAFTP